MLITDDFAFIHIPHTGGAFVRKFLTKFVKGINAVKVEKWHESIDWAEKTELDNKFKFTNIRNPWDWYVSLYHCQKRDNGHWLEIASQGENDDFNTFIKNFLSQDFLFKNIEATFSPPGNVKKPHTTPVFKYMYNHDMGFFSYFYTYICMQHVEELLNPPNHNFLEENHDKLFLLDGVCRCESLESDLIDIFNKFGKGFNLKQKIILKLMPKINQTKRKHYREYYTEETKKLVQHKDRLIINKYGYQF